MLTSEHKFFALGVLQAVDVDFKQPETSFLLHGLPHKGLAFCFELSD